MLIGAGTGTKVMAERRVEGVIVLSLQRTLKGEGESELKERIDRLVREGRTEILIDLGGMPHVDSSELGRLIRSHISVRQAGGRVRLINLCERVASLMKMTHLDTVLEIYNTEEEALALIRGSRGEKSGHMTSEGAG